MRQPNERARESGRISRTCEIDHVGSLPSGTAYASKLLHCRDIPGDTGRWSAGKIETAIRGSKLCILTGAGVSTAIANLPGWNELLQSALDLAHEQRIDDDDIESARRTLIRKPFLAGGQLRGLLSADDNHWFATWLSTIFHRPRVDTHNILLNALVRIHQAHPSIRFATTNYDTILDQHLKLGNLNWCDDVRDVDDFFGPEQSRHLLHIHGTYNKPSTVVFSAEDYARLEGRQHSATTRILAEAMQIR
jgi:hypothetical protein